MPKRVAFLVALGAVALGGCEPKERIEEQRFAGGALPHPVKAHFFAPQVVAQPEVVVGRVEMVRVRMEPGARSGWHLHGGPAWVIVVKGQKLAFYRGDDPLCEPVYLEPGQALLEPGLEIHAIRNEGNEPAELHAIFMLPESVPPRLAASPPPACPF